MEWPHNPRDPARSLARLIDGATYTFVERGYNAATIHDICARAKVGIGTFYAHFQHKKELMQNVMTERAQTLAGSLSPEDFADPDRLARQLRKTVDEPIAAGLWRAWHEAIIDEPDLATFHENWRNAGIDEVAVMIETARRSAATECDVVAPRAAAWATMTLARAMLLVDRSTGPDVETLARMIRCLVFGVMTPGAPVSHKRVVRTD